MTRSLEERLNADPAPGWKPEPGDMLVGTVIEISEAPGTDWGPYPLLTVETDQGDVAVHAFHTVLKDEIARKGVREGDKVGIKYVGIPDGKNYESYRVAVDRAPGNAAAPSSSAPSLPATRHDAEPARQSGLAQTDADDFGEEPF